MEKNKFLQVFQKLNENLSQKFSCNFNQQQQLKAKTTLYAHSIMIKQAIYENLGGKIKLPELIEEPRIEKNRQNTMVKLVSK